MKTKKPKEANKPKDEGRVAESDNGRPVAVADLPIGRLVESPWNTHDKGDADVRGLSESMAKIGIVQRIVVRPVYNGPGVPNNYEIVDGHRRYWAAKHLRMETMPCEIRSLTDAEAQRQTLAANVQRLDNSPILEAELIGRMAQAGQDTHQIAAALGRLESYVVRRMRLVNLADCWREFAKRVPCTVDLLERVAAHETGMQESVAAEVGLDEYEYDEDDSLPCGWDEFENAFERAMRTLDKGCPFDVADCEGCPSSTASHRFLFPDLERDEKAKCQNAACFARKWNAAVDDVLARLKKRGIKVVEVSESWNIPQSWSATASKTKTNTVPYLWEAKGLKYLKWSVPKSADRPADTRTPEEKAAEKERKRREKLAKSAREKIRAAIDDATAGGVETFKAASETTYNELAARVLDRELKSCWHNDSFVDDFAAVYDVSDRLDEDEMAALRETILAKEEAERRLASMRTEDESGEDAEEDGE